MDTYTQLFLWIGEGSTEDEKVKGARFAKQFIADVSIIRNTRQTLRTELFRSQDFLVTVSPFVHIQIVLILSFAFSYVAQYPFLNYIFTCKFTYARIFLNVINIFIFTSHMPIALLPFPSLFKPMSISISSTHSLLSPHLILCPRLVFPLHLSYFFLSISVSLSLTG